MALITRGDKHYLIRSVRMGGRVTSRCVAHGEQAVKLHRAFKALAPERPDAFDRWVARKARREARRATRKLREIRRRDEAIEGRVKGLVAEARELTAEIMKAAGFHQHRWAWRKMRGHNMDPTNTLPPRVVAAILEEINKSIPDQTPEEQARIKAAIAFMRSPAGIAKTVTKWEKYDATRAPGTDSVIATMEKTTGGDPALDIVEDLIGKATDDDCGRELLRRRHRRMVDELAGPNPTAIERHLAERAAVCHLDLQITERLAIRLHDKVVFSPPERTYFDKARDRSHRRYVETLRSLALVRNRASRR